MDEFRVRAIGFIRSELKSTSEAPSFYTQGAPDATLELDPALLDGLDRLEIGQEIIVLTWLHLARRDMLKVHPQGDLSRPLTGVFLTRSPDRPNPIGLHRATVLGMEGNRLGIGPIEAIDGTPVIDIKCVVKEAVDY